MRRKKNKKHLDAVASIGCIVCINKGFGPTPAEVHHLRDGYGAGQRAPDEETLPLCPGHHRLGDGTKNYGYQIGSHQSPLEFERRYGTERELLKQVKEKLCQMQMMP